MSFSRPRQAIVSAPTAEVVLTSLPKEHVVPPPTADQVGSVVSLQKIVAGSAPQEIPPARTVDTVVPTSSQYEVLAIAAAVVTDKHIGAIVADESRPPCFQSAFNVCSHPVKLGCLVSVVPEAIEEDPCLQVGRVKREAGTELPPVLVGAERSRIELVDRALTPFAATQVREVPEPKGEPALS